jgi:hypothetical protein
MVGTATGAEAFIVTLIAYPLLTHPVVELVTVRVPVYVPTAAAPGTTRMIGLTGKTALTTFTKPCPRAAPLYTMLYLSGPFVVALYVRLAVVVPEHTAGLGPNVIVGKGLTVTLMA